MNILLINPSTGYYNRALFNPLGLISIGSHLKRIGNNVKLVDRCIDKSNIKKIIEIFKPEIIGVSLMSSRGIKDALKVSKLAKEHGIPVAWGGAMPTMSYKECLESEFVDYVLMSEGEFTFEELLDVVREKRDKSDVLGLVYKENGEIVRNPDRPFADLADMPVSDFSLVDVDKYMQEYLGCKKMMYLYSSKGCPFNCAFCSNECFHRCKHRKRPNEYVIEEIKYLVENHGLDGVYFSDEQWVINKEDAWDFCRRLKENNLNIRFGIQCRVGIFTKEEFKRLYDAGCRWAFFGVETGSKAILERINKKINYDKIAPTFVETKEAGITSVASFIIGYPDETEEEIKDTIKLAKSLDANLITVHHFTPLEGSRLFEQVVSEGRFSPEKNLKEMSKVIATETVGQNLSNIPSKDLKVIRCCFNWMAFTKKDALEDRKPFEFAFQTVKNGLHAISQKGVIQFFVDGYKAFIEFSYTFWYSHAYKKIKKKYGI